MARLDMCPPLRGQPDPLARDRDSKRLIGHGSNRRPYTRAADTRPTLLGLKNRYAALRPAGWKRWPVEGIPYNFPWISLLDCLGHRSGTKRSVETWGFSWTMTQLSGTRVGSKK